MYIKSDIDIAKIDMSCKMVIYYTYYKSLKIINLSAKTYTNGWSELRYLNLTARIQCLARLNIAKIKK